MVGRAHWRSVGSNPAPSADAVQLGSLIEVVVSRLQGSIPCVSLESEQSDSLERHSGHVAQMVSAPAG